MKFPPPLPPPQPTPTPRRASVPEINAELEKHERDRLSQHELDVQRRQRDHEQWTKDALDGVARHMRGIETKLGQQDAVSIATARAVGVDPHRIPADMAKRSIAPPNASGLPAGEQAPTIPTFSKRLQMSQVLALGVVVFETVREGFSLFHTILSGH